MGGFPGFRAGTSPLHEVGVGEVHVVDVLQPGGREEDPDVGRPVRSPDGDTVVADPAPALLIGRVTEISPTPSETARLSSPPPRQRTDPTP